MAGRQKSPFGVVLIGVLLIGFLSGCGTVKPGITATGTVEMTEVDLSSKVAGKIINLPITGRSRSSQWYATRRVGP